MKIERINDNQIKCTLYRSDLASRHIKLSELAYGTEKTKDLFNDMMEQASSEFGFETNDDPLMIEAIPVSMDCIILMITRVDDPDDIDTSFSAFSNIPCDDCDDCQEDEEEGDILSQLSTLLGNEDGLPELHTEEPHTRTRYRRETAATLALYSFDSMDGVIAFSRTAAATFDGGSRLYKCDEDGRYYLLLDRAKEEAASFARVCNSASEYGRKELMNYARAAYINEHFRKILAVDALGVLAKL